MERVTKISIQKEKERIEKEKRMPKLKKPDRTGSQEDINDSLDLSEWRNEGSKEVFVKDFFESKIKNDTHLLDALEDNKITSG